MPVRPLPQDPLQIVETFEVVRRQKEVHVRQHLANSRRTGPEFSVAEDRVEPDELPAGTLEALHLPTEIRHRVAFEPVR
jgi:hypothetical protein